MFSDGLITPVVFSVSLGEVEGAVIVVPMADDAPAPTLGPRAAKDPSDSIDAPCRLITDRVFDPGCSGLVF